MSLSRRAFIKYIGGATASWVLVAPNLRHAEAVGLSSHIPVTDAARPAVVSHSPTAAVSKPIPGGTLDPTTVTKFVTLLLIPPVMPKAGMIKLKGGKPADYY